MDDIPAERPVLTVEMSMGQMIDDVRLAAEGARKVELMGSSGGVVPTPEEVAQRIREILA